MKKTVLILVTLWTCGASAWLSTSPTQKKYNLKFTLKNETYEVTRSAGSYEDAFSEASGDCLKHFKGARKLSEDEKLDIVDACANPRTDSGRQTAADF